MTTLAEPLTPARLTVWQRLARNALFGRLRTLRHGRLSLFDRTDQTELEVGDSTDLRVSLTVRDPEFYTAVVTRGTIGAAEAYAADHWTTDDPVALVRLFVRNREVLDGMERGLARLTQPLFALFHRLRRNTKTGSRKNIAAHYDLGNEFFAEFLDRTMTYSCGLFESDDDSLEAASIAKLDRICQKLELSPRDHVVEIGSGWGSFAIHAASRYGCRVTATTISRAQYELAAERIAAAGVGDRVTLLERDYRDLDGRFDKLVSIEMIEAVGRDHLDTYLAKCSSLLKPSGRMALQAITITDQHFERAAREVDFIKRYIFPGSFIPSTTAITRAMTRSSDLRLVHLEDMAPHYARTLREWRHRFYAAGDAIRELGYDKPFMRLWEYYLAYCEGGFAERFLGVAQLVFDKPECRSGPLLASFDRAS